MAQLSTGVIDDILLRDLSPEGFVLQVLDIKMMGNGRYRCVLYDGAKQVTCMPATQLGDTLKNETIKVNSIVRIDKITKTDVSNSKVLIIFGWSAIGMGLPLSNSTSSVATAAPVSAPAPPQYGAPPVAPSYGAPAQPSYNAQPPYVAAQSNYGVPAQASYSTAPSYAMAPAAPAAPASFGNSNPYTSTAAPASNPYGGYVPGQHRSGPVVKDDAAAANIIPISAINPYSNKWTIKARVTAKSEIRRWSNARGEGTLFSIDLLDAAGGEIRGTFFKDACEKFYPTLQEGQVYTFSGAVVKAVQNRQYSNLKNTYELTFNASSDIRSVGNDSGIKTQSYSFVKIDGINMIEPNATIDIIGVVKASTDVSEITSQKMGGKQLQKRDLTLIDETGCEIKLTLWGDRATAHYDWASKPIAAFKGVKVGDYGGRSLSSSSSTGITLNPMIDEAFALHQFRAACPDGEIPVGASLSSNPGSSLSGGELMERRKTTSSIKDEGLGMQEGNKADYITVKATTTYIKHDNECWYTACTGENCSKKVTQLTDGQWRCEKCNKEYPTCNYRYIMSAVVADHTGGTWISLFNETAEKLLGVPASKLHEYRTQGQEVEYEKIFQDALFKTFILRLRVKQEQVSDESRVKSSVMKLDDVDFAGESRMLLDAIARYN